jgi:hypothetical protein
MLRALLLIEVFQDVGKNGLDPEDYDAPRWESILALKGATNRPVVASRAGAPAEGYFYP